jgi:hypothetical protein
MLSCSPEHIRQESAVEVKKCNDFPSISDSCKDYEMNAGDFNQLDETEKPHFYRCEQCGEMVDMPAAR